MAARGGNSAQGLAWCPHPKCDRQGGHVLNRVPMSFAFIPLILGCALAGCATVKAVDPLTVPLAYKADPDNNAPLSSFTCPNLSGIQVVDKRSETLLGVRFVEDKPLKADVTAGGDPLLWVRGGIESYLHQNNIKTGQSGPALMVELDSLRTEENIVHRSGYEARITATASLQSASGKSCWRASLQSDKGNYGYIGSVQDYQEVLNRALDGLSSQIVAAPDFTGALCHCAD